MRGFVIVIGNQFEFATLNINNNWVVKDLFGEKDTLQYHIADFTYIFANVKHKNDIYCRVLSINDTPCVAF